MQGGIIRTTALLSLPLLFAAGCNAVNTNGAVANSADTGLDGCTTDSGTCNPATMAGVVADIDVDEDSGEMTIRFVQLSDLTEESLTYSDGKRTVLFSGGEGVYTGEGGELLALESFGSYTDLLGATWSGDLDTTGSGAFGVSGNHTDADAVPTEGGALYSGLAIFAALNGASEPGSSILDVNFGEGTADLYGYTGPLLVGPSAAAELIIEDPELGFDTLESLGMEIDGYTFTGGDVKLYNNDELVNVTGANTKSASAGMFFGPIDVIEGAPEEFGAVAIVTGDDNAVVMNTLGELGGGGLVVLP